MKKRYVVVVGLGVATLVAVTIVAVGTGTGPNPTTVGITPPPSQSPSSPAGLTASPSASSTPPAAQALLHTIAQLQRKRAADPDDVTVLLALGDADFAGQRYRAAAQAYQQALVIKPANATASVRLAMVWHAEGQSEQAMKAIKAVLARTPADQEAHYSLAIVYFSLNRAADARSEWATAYSIDPTSVIGRASESFVKLLDGTQTAEPRADGD